jgi:hypothetical protein
MMIESLSAIEDLGEGHKWIKLAFDIVEVRRIRMGVASVEGVSFVALGNAPTGEVGFEVGLPLGGWDGKEVAPALSIEWGRIGLFSLGLSTDRLLRLLKVLFDLPNTERPAVREVSCEACLLGNDPAEIEPEEMHLKLFFNGESAERPESYAELYLNFDLAQRRAYLMEKDAYYRAPLIAWLSGRFRQPGESLH